MRHSRRMKGSFVLAAAIAALASHAQLNAQDRTRADQPLSPDAPPPRARLAELGELHTQLGRQTLYAVERAAPEAAELVVSLDPTGRDPFRILDRVLLQFEPEVPPAEVRAILSRHGITGPLAPLGRLPNAWMATGSSARRALDSAAALAGEPKVLWAQPDMIIPTKSHGCVQVIDDPDIDEQWYLEAPSVEPAGISAFDAWCETLGAGARIAVIDTGINEAHVELATQICPSGLLSDSDNEGHGTSVCGSALGDDNEDYGRGVAPDACLIFSSQFSDRAGTTTQSVSDFVTDLYDADALGASVHTNSWGFGTPTLPDAFKAAIQDLSVNGRDGKGLLFFFAAANDGLPLYRGSNWPATIAQVVAVASVDRSAQRSDFSNFGTPVDIAAPGGNVWVIRPDGSTANVNGTSISSPLAAGVAALMLSVNPDLEAEQVRRILRHTARRPEVSPCQQFDPITETSASYGHGIVDAAAAVAAALEAVANGGWTWPAKASTLSFSVVSGGLQVSWTNPLAATTGAMRGEYAGALLVRRTLDAAPWAPQDGVSYTTGEVETGVTVVAVGDINQAVDEEYSPFDAAMYTVHIYNPELRYSKPSARLRQSTKPVLLNGSGSWQFTGDFEEDIPNRAVNSALGIGVVTAYEGSTVFGTNTNSSNNMVEGFSAGDTIDSSPTVHTLTSPVYNLTSPLLTSASVKYHEVMEVFGRPLDGLGTSYATGAVRVLNAQTGQTLGMLVECHGTVVYDWTPRECDLTPYLGYSIQLVWELAAINSPPPNSTHPAGRFVSLGWWIDGVEIRATAEPGDFDLLSPADSAENIQPTVLLDWESSAFATSYRLRVSESASLTDPVIDTVVGAHQYAVPGGILSHCGVYYWGVEATNAVGSVDSTPAVASFQVRGRADLNANGVVDYTDLNILLSSWGACPSPPVPCDADLNEDGVVNGTDLADLLTSYGTACP